LILAILIKLI